MSAVLGVDPGVNGGLCVLGAGSSILHRAKFWPDMTRKDFLLVSQSAVNKLRAAGGVFAFLEKVGHIPGDGPQGSFTFGRVYGWCEMALTADGVYVRDVPPILWQTKLDCLTGGDKNVSKRRAQTLWPTAALIAEFGRRALAALERSQGGAASETR